MTELRKRMIESLQLRGLSERTQEGALGATFVARRWRTFASVRLAAEFKGTRFVTIPDTTLAAICPGCDERDLLGGSVTLALTHVVSPLLSGCFCPCECGW